MGRPRDFFHTGLDVSRSEIAGAVEAANRNPFGDSYYVRTDGDNADDGNTLERALETVQEAVTRQIDNNSGLGDAIYIMTGTYAESVTASTLVDCTMVGVGVPGSVVIAPTDSHALLIGADGTDSVTMLRSSLNNITFKTPSTSNTNYAAVTIAYMLDSVIEGCRFLGTTTTTFELDVNMTIGLQISNRTSTEWEFHERNIISGCKFTTQGSRLQELGIGLLVGSTATGAPASRGFSQNIIENCDFATYDTGLRLRTGASSNGGTIVRWNTFTGNQGGSGSNYGILSNSTDGTDELTLIADNRIVAISDGISNFATWNTHGNIVSISQGAPANETGQ